MLPEIEKIKKYRKRFIRSVDRFDTPQYILIADELEKRINLINHLKKHYPNTDIYYHYMASCLPFICKLMHKSNIHADVSSLFELKLALKLKAKKIMFNGPGKTKEELDLAILNSDKVIISVDNYQELKEIIKISNRKNRKVSVGLRIYIKSNDIRWLKFGIKHGEVNHILKTIKKERNIKFEGFNFHICTGTNPPSIYESGLKELGKIISNLKNEEREKIRFIDIGGGFGVNGYYLYGSNKKETIIRMLNKSYNGEYNLYRNKPIDMYIKTITNCFKKYILPIKNVGNPNLILEPGRWFVSPCMHLLTRVLYKKGGNSAILDASTNVCPPLLREYHPIINLTNLNKYRKKCILYGSALFHLGIFGRYFYGGGLKEDDTLCIMNMGGYMETFSWQFSKPLAKIIALSNNKLKEIKREEDFDYRFGRDVWIK